MSLRTLRSWWPAIYNLSSIIRITRRGCDRSLWCLPSVVGLPVRSGAVSDSALPLCLTSYGCVQEVALQPGAGTPRFCFSDNYAVPCVRPVLSHSLLDGHVSETALRALVSNITSSNSFGLTTPRDHKDYYPRLTLACLIYPCWVCHSHSSNNDEVSCRAR